MESTAERAWRSHPLSLLHLSNLDLSLLHDWFTHHRFMKLQHECPLKEGSCAINHKSVTSGFLCEVINEAKLSRTKQGLLLPRIPSEVPPEPPLGFKLANSGLAMQHLASLFSIAVKKEPKNPPVAFMWKQCKSHNPHICDMV